MFALALVLGVAACGGAGLERGFEDELTTTRECQGFLYATSEDQSLILVFRPGSTTAEVAAQVSGSELYDFDAGTVAVLYVETGSGLGDGFCGDTTGQTETRYHAIGGKADFRAEAAVNGGFDVTLALRGVLFAQELGDGRVLVAELDLAGHMP